MTLVELVAVLAILGIIIALALPRYWGARKNSYRAEADNLLQEVKGLEWGYYQQHSQFDTTGSFLGLVLPGGMHWGAPTFSGNAAQSVAIQITGSMSPLSSTDSLCLTLYTDGSAATGLTCASSTGGSSTGGSSTGGSSTGGSSSGGSSSGNGNGNGNGNGSGNGNGNGNGQ